MSSSHAGPGMKADRNLSDLYDAVAAWNHIKQVASETQSGAIELATAAEVTAGTPGALAVTPSSLLRGQSNGVAALDASAKLSISIFPGTPTGGTFLRGDGVWVALPGGGNMLTATYDPALNGYFAIAQGGTGATTAAGARTALGLVIGTDVVAPGAITGAGLTQATAKLLGRTTAGTGAPEELTVSGLTLAAGVLTNTFIGETVKKTFNKTTHGFVAKDAVKCVVGVWDKAQADSAANSEAVGIVESSVDADNFVVVMAGLLTATGFTTGEQFLSPSSAGALTTTEPSTSGQIRRSLGNAVSTTQMIVRIQQPGIQVP